MSSAAPASIPPTLVTAATSARQLPAPGIQGKRPAQADPLAAIDERPRLTRPAEAHRLEPPAAAQRGVRRASALVTGPELDAGQAGYGPGYRIYAAAADGGWLAHVLPDKTDWGRFEQIGPLLRCGPEDFAGSRLMLPGVGEHTVEILGELGFTPAEIDVLLAAEIARQLEPGG